MRFNRTLFFTPLLAAAAWAAPVTNDAWDTSQAGHVTATVVSALGIVCGAPDNLFGGTFQTVGCFEGNERVVLADNIVNIIEWGTANTNITSFDLYAQQDQSTRALGRLQLSYWDGSSFVEFYDSGILPFPGPVAPIGETTPLLSVTLGTSVTSTLWRAAFSQSPSAGSFPGPRVIELDGFGTLVDNTVPEPSSLALSALGATVLALTLRKRAGSR